MQNQQINTPLGVDVGATGFSTALNYGSLETNGDVRDAALFDRVLTDDEVQMMYNSGTPVNIKSLDPLSWWRMGDLANGGAVIPDLGSARLDGRLTSGEGSSNPNIGTPPDIQPPAVTPSVTPTVTPSVTTTPSVTPTVTPSVTVTPTVTCLLYTSPSPRARG